ncbi:MAG: glycosyltransferase family 4 protein [Tenuifilaceae bacterium]
MNILMLLEHDFPGDVRVDKEVQSLYEAGHQVIVASSSQSNRVLYEKKENCIIYRKIISPFINKSSVGALKFPFYFNFWYIFVSQIIEREKIDVIHIHDLPLARVGWEFKRKLGVKLVIDLHENYPALLEISQHTQTFIGKLLSSTKQWRKCEVDMCNKADAVITVVQEMKDRITNLGINPDKIYIVENTPYPISNTLSKSIDSNYFTLTYVGGVTEARGLQHILEGMKILLSKKDNIRLWIVGDGRYLPELKKITSSLGIDNAVKFFGKVPSSEAFNLLAKTDVAIVPHVRSEQSDNSSPNKLFEYMSAGIPVIASNCKSIERIINETGAGLTYTHDSAEDFAEKLFSIYKKSDILYSFSENGKSSFLAKFNWQLSSQDLIKLYTNISI